MNKFIHMEFKSLSENQPVGDGTKITQAYLGSWPLYFILVVSFIFIFF